jgi:hypothetical protein
LRICIDGFICILYHAQVDEEIQDTIKTGFSVGKIKIKDPQSILSAYSYDPVTDRYIYTNSVDGFQLVTPLY